MFEHLAMLDFDTNVRLRSTAVDGVLRPSTAVTCVLYGRSENAT